MNFVFIKIQVCYLKKYESALNFKLCSIDYRYAALDFNKFSIFGKKLLMKKTILVFTLVSFGLLSCGGDDASNDNTTEEIANYFPLTQGTYWTYNNVSQDTQTRDSLYVAGTEVLNGNTYTNLDASTPENAFMTRTLAENLLRVEESRLILNGELGGPPVDGFPDISIPLNDVILFDSQESPQTVLSELEGEISQEIQGYPITINYVLKTVQGENLNTHTVDGETFNTVTTSKIILNLTITLALEINGIPFDLPILDPESQDIIIVTNYYAENIGLIDSNVLVAYSLIDLSQAGIDLPIPQEDSQTATQKIDSYNISD